MRPVPLIGPASKPGRKTELFDVNPRTRTQNTQNSDQTGPGVDSVDSVYELHGSENATVEDDDDARDRDIEWSSRSPIFAIVPPCDPG